MRRSRKPTPQTIANVGDAVLWTRPFLLWWALPLDVLAAVAGSARARRRRVAA